MLYYWRQRAKKGLMSTLSIQRSKHTDLSRTFRIPDEKPSALNPDCWQCVDTRLIRYWCCTIEDREQRKGLCQHCQYKDQSIQIWVEHFEYRMKSLALNPDCWQCVDTRLIRYWCCTIEDREQRKGLCQHCQYKDQSIQIWVEHFEYRMKSLALNPDCWQCVDTRLIRYWCCTIEDREQRKGLCQHCQYKDQSIQIWVEHFEYRMKSLPHWIRIHPVLMLYYWRQRAKKGLMSTLSIQRSKHAMHLMLCLSTLSTLVFVALWGVSVNKQDTLLNTQ